MGKHAQYPNSRNCEHKDLEGMVVFTLIVNEAKLIKNDLHIVNQSYNDVVKSAIPMDQSTET